MSQIGCSRCHAHPRKLEGTRRYQLCEACLEELSALTTPEDEAADTELTAEEQIRLELDHLADEMAPYLERQTVLEEKLEAILEAEKQTELANLEAETKKLAEEAEILEAKKALEEEAEILEQIKDLDEALDPKLVVS